MELKINNMNTKRKNSSMTKSVSGGPKNSCRPRILKAHKKPKNSPAITRRKRATKAKKTILGANSLPFNIFPTKENFCFKM